MADILSHWNCMMGKTSLGTKLPDRQDLLLVNKVGLKPAVIRFKIKPLGCETALIIKRTFNFSSWLLGTWSPNMITAGSLREFMISVTCLYVYVTLFESKPPSSRNLRTGLYTTFTEASTPGHKGHGSW